MNLENKGAKVNSIIEKPQYTLFLDESGDDNLNKIDPQNHLLGVGGILVKEEYYNNVAVDSIKAFKKSIFGTDEIILHSYHVRNKMNEFKCLKNETLNERFKNEYDELIDSLEFDFISRVIDKNELKRRYVYPHQPYQLALELISESFIKILYRRGGIGRIILEARDKKPNRLIRRAYRNILAGGTKYYSADQFRRVLSPELSFIKKEENCHGLQISDFGIYTITSAHLHSNFSRRDYQRLLKKLDPYHGIKYFPDNTKKRRSNSPQSIPLSLQI